MTDKQELRRIARQRRRNFVASLDSLAHRLAFKALPSPLLAMLEPCHMVALYMPVGDEAPATRLAAALTTAGKSLCLPQVIDRVGNMNFVGWREDDQLFPGPFGTSHPEPGGGIVAPDAIITPLIGFDPALNRLGQGGGYYDRIFARYPDAIRIGLAWSVQEFEKLEADPWDVPLHAVLTECAFFEGVD